MIQQMLRGVRDLTTGLIERFLVGLRRLGRPRDLADILQGSLMHLDIGRGRLEIVELADVPTHTSTVFGDKQSSKCTPPRAAARTILG